MIYDIYDASIHSYPAGRLSDGVSFDRKILEIRQIPGGFLFPRISCHFEFIYLLSGTMEFRIRQKAFLVSSGEGFFIRLVLINLMTATLSFIVFHHPSYFRPKTILCIRNISDP